MDKAHPLSTLIIVRSLDINKDSFRPHENDKELFGAEIPYLSAIGPSMYLANNSRPDIAFSVSLYLMGSTDMGLFYSNKSKSALIGYADAGYLSDSHKARSQTDYLFTCGEKAKVKIASKRSPIDEKWCCLLNVTEGSEHCLPSHGCLWPSTESCLIEKELS
ncbi:PREDICTED: uncharacterized protein LOC109207687 [Nicotiana attenuata]|uniref:uncharacterized protein LOC109207687 n=1 Tax=Nicotiana attenuata TaxID=49451 RepID=UPI000904EACB|nr:PREDICTED: uncharacterized protein LOC109207687 [Nicotiana attenuata]